MNKMDRINTDQNLQTPRLLAPDFENPVHPSGGAGWADSATGKW
jgi:hypothetical protein